MSDTIRRESLSAVRHSDAETSLALAREGDLKAFEELVHLVSPPVLHRIGWLHHSDPDQSSGVLQDAWLLAWQQIETFESAEHLTAWMHRVAQYRAISVLRREHRALATTWGDHAGERLLIPEPASRVTATSVDAVSAAIARARGEKQSGVAGRTAKLHESLQPGLSEMYFCERLVLVEGTSDRAYVLASMELLGKWPQLRSLGIHVVPVEGKSHMIQPLAIAHALGIPTFVAFDGDTAQGAKSADKKTMHEKDNRTLLGLCGHPPHGAHPWTTARLKNCTMWGDTTEAAIKQSMDPQKYDAIRNKVLLEFDQEPDLGKDTLYVYRLLEELDAQKSWPPVLTELCDSILTAFT